MGIGKEVLKGVIIVIIVDIVVLGLPHVANLLGLDFPYDILHMDVPLWITVLAVIIIIPTVAMVSRRRRHTGFLAAVRGRPRHIHWTLSYAAFGVLWNVLYGRSFTFTQPYAFCESEPLCPHCKYEMKAKQSGLLKLFHWHCDRCGKSYRCPEEGPYEASDVVERLVESDIRSGRIKLKDV